VKSELSVNLLHSRIYPFIFARAEAMGLIIPRITPVIEASAGGAAIAFTHCANVLGFNEPQPPQVVVPSYLSKLRLEKLEQLKATVHKVFPGEGDDSTVHLLEKLLSADKAEKGGKIGSNPNRLYCCTKTQKGMEKAYASLANEACEQLSGLVLDAKFDYFIGCVGSGSSITGVGRRMKSLNPDLKVLAAEHELTPIIQSLKKGTKLVFDKYPHPFHGASHWGVDVEKLNIDYNVINDFECFETELAQETQTIINKNENLSVGLTTSGAISVALRHATKVQGKDILVIAYDSYEQSQLD